MAMPIEAANIYFRDSSFDAGFSVGGLTLEKLMGYQFKIIHWPGLYASEWVDRIHFPTLGDLVIVASGYLDTVLLLIAVIFLFRWFRPRSAKRSSRPNDPTES